MEHQLELFPSYLIPENNDYTNVYDFLVNLPVFVYQNNNPNLFEINREFIYKKQRYMVKINRTRLSKDDDNFLSLIDQDVLDTLLYLATRKDTKRQVVDGRVRILVSINQIYTQMKKKVRYENIKRSINRLKATQITIKPLDTSANNIEWNTETFISQSIIKDERHTKNGDIETFIEFNTSFSKELLKGRYKLLNFPEYIQLKSPIARFVYKKLVLCDCWTSNNYDKIYHNKSLFTFLLNCGYQTTTTQDKNNTIRAFRQGMKELEKKGIVKNWKIETEIKNNGVVVYQYKKGNKNTDFYLTITPSKYLVDENHKQRKKKRFKKSNIKSLPKYNYED